MLDFGSFVYGTHYWRPPTPPAEDHVRHLTRIKRECGFDLVKFRLPWNYLEREPASFVFDEVHQLFDICDRLELGVLLELSLENAPYWLEQQYPEARYVNANGRAIELGAQEATPSGGHPGLCLHHPAVHDQAGLFIRRLVNEFKDRVSLALYDCWNEPHLEPAWCNMMGATPNDTLFCYCENSRRAFRRWLEDTYGDINALNAAWARAYTDFRQLNPPILNGNYADWLDWFRFWFDQLQDNMQWRVNTIKQEDPNRKVISHSGAVPPVLPRANAVIHNWKFSEPVDIWGSSFAPQAFGWPLSTCAMVAEVTRSAARGKPYWISEMPGGPSNILGFRRSWSPTEKHYRVWNWLSIACGSAGTMHWCYLPERTGHESGCYGMMRPDGAHTVRSLAITHTAALIRQQKDLATKRSTPTQVAVLYDPNQSSLLYAMELTDDKVGKAHTGYYRAIWAADLNARYLTEEDLDSIAEPVLILPLPLLLSDLAIDKITAYVAQGGVLITEARTGMFDEHGFTRPTVPAGALADAAGIIEEEPVCSDPDNVPTIITADGGILQDPHADLPVLDPMALGPEICFSEPHEAVVRAQGYLVPLQPITARPIGTCGDHVVATVNRHGNGYVYYIGTYLGFALGRRDEQALDWVRTILLSHAQPPIRGNTLRPRQITTGPTPLLAVFNDHRTDTVTDHIKLPCEAGKAFDIYSDRHYRIEQGVLTLTVPPEDCIVLRLHE